MKMVSREYSKLSALLFDLFLIEFSFSGWLLNIYCSIQSIKFSESNDRVDVDVFLIQVCSKRRGGSMTSVTKTLLRTVSVPVNPTKEEHHDPLLISHECFSNSHILPIKPLILCLCVNTSPMNSPMANGQCNGKLSSSDGKTKHFNLKFL